jgi:Glyoxalase-like domain
METVAARKAPAAAGMIGSMIGRMHHVVLDCPDPAALAAFYSALLGLPVTYDDGDWAVVAVSDASSGLAFQRATGNPPPTLARPRGAAAIPSRRHGLRRSRPRARECWPSERGSLTTITSTPIRRVTRSALSRGPDGRRRLPVEAEAYASARANLMATVATADHALVRQHQESPLSALRA